MKVLVADKLANEGLKILKSEKSLRVDIRTDLPPEKLGKIIKDYDIIAVRSVTKLTQDLLKKAKMLKLVVRAGIGVDNIDVKTATQQGVIVENTPGGNIITTAEHTLALMMACARNISQAHESLRKGEWKRSSFMGLELTSKTLGVIGLGNIGRVVAERAQGLKMRVLGYDPFLPAKKAKELGVELVRLDDVLAQSDFITLHVPLLASTKNMISKKEIAHMKKGVCLINCARGGLINEEDLLNGLKSGKIQGAALDVFEQEPPHNNPLVKHPSVVCTPHLGASSGEAQVNVAIDCAKQIVDYATKKIIVNAVNVPSITKEALDILNPFLKLVEKMGKFANQIQLEIKKLDIEYAGDLVKFDLRPLTATLLYGFFSEVLGKGVNFVNAPNVAQERGLEVTESKTSVPHDFTSLVTLRIEGVESSHIISGTIFGKSEPRIVKIDNFNLDALPEGHLLVIKNHDKPNVIGNIGRALGKNKINISRMHLGLDKSKKEALSLINIDTKATEKILKDIEKLPDIIQVKQIFL